MTQATTHPIPDAALESDIAILGKKGRGKSFTARGLVERLLDGKEHNGMPEVRHG